LTGAIKRDRTAHRRRIDLLMAGRALRIKRDPLKIESSKTAMTLAPSHDAIKPHTITHAERAHQTLSRPSSPSLSFLMCGGEPVIAS
jgi:hypothetical protein